MGFMLTAAIPSLSGVDGYKLVLTGVHNVCAPLSMLFCMLMETIQLGFGEHVFSHFFSSEPIMQGRLNLGPLTGFQRIRVVVLLFAWIAGCIFVSVQGYLAFVPNRRYSLALVSYYGEVLGLTLAFALPAMAGFEHLLKGEQQTPIEQVTGVIMGMLNESMRLQSSAES